MTPAERKAAEERMAEIGRQIEALRRERVEIRSRLVHAAAEWLDALARLSTVKSREEVGAEALRAREARRANRDTNPTPFNELAEDRHDREAS